MQLQAKRGVTLVAATRSCPRLAADPNLRSVLGPNDRGELEVCYLTSDTVLSVICVLRNR